MSPGKQLEDAVFYAATGLTDLAQRNLFLEQACVGNPELRAAVEEMLDAQGDAEHFFAKGRSALQLSADEFPVSIPRDGVEGSGPADEQIGMRIGPYRLLQRIGEGGCGVVYMAEQEQPVRRKVAVKIIKLGMDTKSVIARFSAERQALALMDHPNIAHVLDAGATETGRPYFVMELVRGVKITDYCDQNQLDTSHRLELFIQICQAIQHAHQKGIIHRDIKPSNILVTLHDGVPVPKVIDFGIAKATEGKLTEQTLFTPYQQLIGTPAYMSPEQAEMSALDVDTRSDIYSLGVLLYELLTGKTPFDGKELVRSGLDEMRRTLREKEPQRPSTILTTLVGADLKVTATHRQEEAPRLISLLKGDLDWIVMKALEKDRKRRYQTANGLVMDVQRHLNNEPVVARPPSRLYRLKKLVRRNRVVFAAGAAVATALIVGLTVSTWLYFKEKEARREQVRLREQAERAERKENELRQQAEARAKITQAAIYVSQEKFDQANQLLNEIQTPPPRPSFDGVEAYRSVGDWLGAHGRWQEAAKRYLALMEIDKLDQWRAVTLDYQACGVVLVQSGKLAEYDRFRKLMIDAFVSTTNGDAAGRILKTCVLLPVGTNLMARLQPLGKLAEAFATSAPGLFNGWAAIPASLWRYRQGNYAKAVEWCQQGFKQCSKNSAQYATLQIIVAMADWKMARLVQSRFELAQSWQTVAVKFKTGLGEGNAGQGYWYDWVFARILLNEAEALIQPAHAKATPP